MTKIKIISCDDWTGCYVNGKLVAQNHSLDPSEVLNFVPNVEFTSDHCDKDLEPFGWSLPEDLEEIEKYIKEK